MTKRNRMSEVSSEVSDDIVLADHVCSSTDLLHTFLVYLDMQVRNIQNQDAVSGSTEDRSMVLQAELRAYRAALCGDIPKTWSGYQQRFFATMPGNGKEVALYRKLREKYGDCE